MNHSKRLNECPFVSIIMPIYNEAEFIERSFGALLEQSYPKHRFEIIVADGMSTDNTTDIIGQMAAASPVAVTIIENPEQIAPTGLNRAIKKAVGDIIVRIDGHTIIAVDYVERCVELLQRTDCGNVGGRMTAVSNNIIGNAIALATSSRFGIGNARFHYADREEFVDTVYLGAWPRKIFDKFGFFNEELVRNQDDEYNYRIRKLGGKILLSPDIRSKYYSRSTFRSLWRQYYQYGYWKVRVLQLHPGQMSLRQFVPFAFVMSIIILGLSSLFFYPAGWLLAALALVYLLANLAASFLAAGRRFWLVPYIFVSFCILHVSYGLGSMAGLVAFRKRWGESVEIAPDRPDRENAPSTL